MPAVTNAWADRLLELLTSRSRTPSSFHQRHRRPIHDRMAFTGELHAGSRGEMTHDRRAVQHVDFILAQAFQRLRLIFGQIDRAADVSDRNLCCHDSSSLFVSCHYAYSHDSSGHVVTNLPERSSINVSSISRSVFITNGPYRAIGSPNGFDHPLVSHPLADLDRADLHRIV